MRRYENEDFSTIVVISVILAFSLGMFVEYNFHIINLLRQPLGMTSEVQK